MKIYLLKEFYKLNWCSTKFFIYLTGFSFTNSLGFFFISPSARMMWVGPHAKYNKPEARSYSFWIKDTDDNNFIRQWGIRCLADHEIGTHFVSYYVGVSQRERKREKERFSLFFKALKLSQHICHKYTIYVPVL